MVVRAMDNQVTISGYPPRFFGCPYLEYTYKGAFSLHIYGCLSDNYISIFGCPGFKDYQHFEH